MTRPDDILTTSPNILTIRPDILAGIEQATWHAIAKHGPASIHLPFRTDADCLEVLADELEEVRRAVIAGDVDGPHGLRAELLQVAAAAIGWLGNLRIPPEATTADVLAHARASYDFADAIYFRCKRCRHVYGVMPRAWPATVELHVSECRG